MATPQVEVLGYGTKFEIYSNNDYAQSGGTWATVFAELVDIEPPADKVGDIDSSHFNSPGMAKQRIAGWITPGVCKIKAHYLAAEFNTLVGYGTTTKAWRIVYNDSTDQGFLSSSSSGGDYSGVEFNGYISEKPQKVNMEGMVVTEITITVTGLTNWVGSWTTN